MKIGVFDPYLDSLSGGEKYILTVAECLLSEHEVSIFWDPSSEQEIKNKAKEKFDLNLDQLKFVPNIFTKNISLVKRFLLSQKYDLIIFLSDGSLPFVASRLFIHFQFPVEWINLNPLLRVKLLRTEKIICNSYFTKSFIDQKFSINSIVLYPPANITVEKKVKKENIILHVGRFGISKEGSNFKKQDVMIETFKQMIINGLTGWRFVVVVSLKDQDRDKLEELKKKAGGFPIEFMENIQNSLLLELYGRAKIYWHASGFGEDLIAHPERAEHFGIATVEAMARGAVPVVIKAGGQVEIVDNGENGFLWDTIDEFMEKTLKLMQDKGLWEQMSQKAIKKAENFGKERFKEEINRLVK